MMYHTHFWYFMIFHDISQSPNLRVHLYKRIIFIPRLLAFWQFQWCDQSQNGSWIFPDLLLGQMFQHWILHILHLPNTCKSWKMLKIVNLRSIFILFIYLFIDLFVYLFIYSFIYLFIYLIKIFYQCKRKYNLQQEFIEQYFLVEWILFILQLSMVDNNFGLNETTITKYLHGLPFSRWKWSCSRMMVP